jgi:hypothetical protein
VPTINQLKNKLKTYGHLSLENLELRASNKRPLSTIKKIINKAHYLAKGLLDMFTNAHEKATA